MKILLISYVVLWVGFLYLIYRFFQSELERLNPPKRPFIPFNSNEIVNMDSITEAVESAKKLQKAYKDLENSCNKLKGK